MGIISKVENAALTIVVVLAVMQSAVIAHSQDEVTKIQQLRDSVFKVISYDSNGKEISTGSGFFAGSNNTAITNVHVLRGASSAKIVFPHSDLSADVTVVAVDHSLDIAVIKPIRSLGDKVQYLQLARANSLEGTQVRAVGYPEGMGFTVTAGIVNANRVWSEFPDQFRINSGLKSNANIVQTDAALNPGNSGGPLVALDNTVIAVNTMFWSGNNEMFFSICATECEQILSKLPAVAGGFGLININVEHAIVMPQRRPIPRIAIAKTQRPERMLVSLRSLVSATKCRFCGGSGRVERRGRSMGRQTIMGPESRIVISTGACHECSVSGYNSTANSDRLWQIFTNDLVKSDPEHGSYLAAISAVSSRLKEGWATPSRSAGKINSHLFSFTIENNPPSVEAPLWGIGTLEMFRKGEFANIYLVSIDGYSYDIVLLDVADSDAKVGNTVLFCGLYAGNYEIAQFDIGLIVQGGIVLAVE